MRVRYPRASGGLFAYVSCYYFIWLELPPFAICWFFIRTLLLYLSPFWIYYVLTPFDLTACLGSFQLPRIWLNRRCEGLNCCWVWLEGPPIYPLNRSKFKITKFKCVMKYRQTIKIQIMKLTFIGYSSSLRTLWLDLLLHPTIASLNLHLVLSHTNFKVLVWIFGIVHSIVLSPIHEVHLLVCRGWFLFETIVLVRSLHLLGGLYRSAISPTWAQIEKVLEHWVFAKQNLAFVQSVRGTVIISIRAITICNFIEKHMLLLLFRLKVTRLIELRNTCELLLTCMRQTDLEFVRAIRVLVKWRNVFVWQVQSLTHRWILCSWRWSHGVLRHCLVLVKEISVWLFCSYNRPTSLIALVEEVYTWSCVIISSPYVSILVRISIVQILCFGWFLLPTGWSLPLLILVVGKAFNFRRWDHWFAILLTYQVLQFVFDLGLLLINKLLVLIRVLRFGD